MEINETEKPLAIFICGPVAAGKSSTIRYLKDKGLDQGVLLDYDHIYKQKLESCTKANEKLVSPLNKHEVENIADKKAWDKREGMYDACIKDKRTFTFETTMPDHVFDKMKTAKEAGFNVQVYITFQKSVEKHIESEKNRRDAGKEIGGFFKHDDHAKDTCIQTYDRCIKGIEKSMPIADKVNIYINYMKKGPPEQNRPVMVAEKDKRKSESLIITPDKKIDNLDLKQEFSKIKAKEKVKNLLSEKSKNVEKVLVKEPGKPQELSR